MRFAFKTTYGQDLGLFRDTVSRHCYLALLAAVTGGLKGKAVTKPSIFGVSFASDAAFYFLCLVVLMGALWLTVNVLRTPTGRAWVAIRDSEIAAQSMGVNLAVYKTMAFAYSA